MHNPVSTMQDAVFRTITFAYVQALALSMLVLPVFLSHEHNAMPHITSWTDYRIALIIIVWSSIVALLYFAFKKRSGSDRVTDLHAFGEKVDGIESHAATRRSRLLAALVIALVPYVPASHVRALAMCITVVTWLGDRSSHSGVAVRRCSCKWRLCWPSVRCSCPRLARASSCRRLSCGAAVACTRRSANSCKHLPAIRLGPKLAHRLAVRAPAALMGPRNRHHNLLAMFSHQPRRQHLHRRVSKCQQVAGALLSCSGSCQRCVPTTPRALSRATAIG